MTSTSGAVDRAPGLGTDTAGGPVQPILVLGLGNDLAGDDGIGVRVARQLASDPGLPDDVEVQVAGTDLLRVRDAMRGRDRVILIDALLGPDEPGTVSVLDPADPSLADAGGSAHQLSPTAALAVLRAADPALADVPVTLLGVAIERADMMEGLSDALAGRLETITTGVLRHISEAPHR